MASKNDECWTLGETLMWVLTRDMQYVDRATLKATSNVKIQMAYYINPEKEPYELYDEEPFAFQDNEGIHKTLIELKDNLKLGKIKAYGEKEESSGFQEILAHEWKSIDFSSSKTQDYDILKNGNKIEWISPHFCKENIIAQWPGDVIRKDKKRGRPSGAGAYDDDLNISKMHGFIEDGTCKSPNDAATKMVNEELVDLKNAAPESVIRRLSLKYKIKYMSDKI